MLTHTVFLLMLSYYEHENLLFVLTFCQLDKIFLQNYLPKTINLSGNSIKKKKKIL